ncbi:hypothetical protein VTK73DRAFT_5338 [Phialemonium thermophilum]|uniref:glutaminase n=1 Tax=Phialemonium thermophilum TaxID=223376 RepID=A0ABR3Y8W2_9PEZI
MTVVTIGVLALQGGFQEHLTLLRKAAAHLKSQKASVVKNCDLIFIEVRNKDDLSRCDGLVIPGGESTTIALTAARSGLLEPLRSFVKIDRKPTWGTCAGLILLSEEANATTVKKGGQDLIGGLDVRVQRNHFGRQIESFVAEVDLPFLVEPGDGARPEPSAPFPGVFIRAPIVEELLSSKGAPAQDGQQGDSKSDIEVLAVLPARRTRAKGNDSRAAQLSTDANDIVAVRQGNVFGTSFHPELTSDIRVHAWWLTQALKQINSQYLA